MIRACDFCPVPKSAPNSQLRMTVLAFFIPWAATAATIALFFPAPTLADPPASAAATTADEPRPKSKTDSPSSNSRPNIVFIFSDDHAWQTISAYGSKLVQTPNLDRLA